MKRVKQGRTVLAYMGIVLFIFLINGCATVNEGDEGAGTQDKGFAPPIYYDFGDVRLPEELKVDKKSSFVYRTQGFSAGALVLEGRVERYSLIAFFENSMATESWKFICSFNSPRTIMLFQKESRWCVINITDGKLSTLVEIWVAPTADEAPPGLMK
ncbi:MAG: hypothetical protein JRJ20_02830 [Deltaproteobacteria bacterium]|nr:hypothetical protein [Deltaproteobacteria bacterium]